MPTLSQTSATHRRIALPTDCSTSIIRRDESSRWEHASPQQCYNALVPWYRGTEGVGDPEGARRDDGADTCLPERAGVAGESEVGAEGEPSRTHSWRG
ncbi:uncharacterized protein B0H18DRAFT_1175149 [Fomitopsis serialis]|uniref:uncharacterized protein n=1 Tax=Fomitopsis serialis TaxID=139415 RepID=UPI0020086E21|nr:uncharacterized protein B0H18DRAFT_1175149 [Neoantrodia serialis]KAH9924489.1 hypothetical protein B0H18DRAFT_1175149 [Neoantrodia serialis]